MSDDLAMHALSGGAGEWVSRALAAGCDVGLHCSGVFADNVDIVETLAAEGATGLSEAASARLALALPVKAKPSADNDLAELVAKRDALLAFA